MELQQLRYVVAVAETKHFTRAAEQCHVVQSALSHQVAVLERELGYALFARTSRRVALTPAGEAFLPHALAALDAAASAASAGAAATGEIRGTLTIGTIPTTGTVDVPAALAEFRARYPAVRITLRTHHSDRLIERVRAGRIDVAVLGLPEPTLPEDVGAALLGAELLMGVVSRAHRLAGRRRVPLAQLTAEPFVDFPAGSPARAQSDRAFASAGLERDVQFESSALDSSLRLIEAGLAVGLLPAVVAQRESHRIAAFSVSPTPRRHEVLIWNAFNPSPAAERFREILLAQRAAGEQRVARP
ncbi:LysR family transcriptional regulator [Leucobacter chromiireducens]|uniref:LysR family transcriptional regulator n=1 Tax=Leucobacter chromiireducens TaxID=283877 RepID=UPI000F62DFCF|nr:LysR family transcriptional regulator [Leucobacter chromiireducens]